MDARLATYIAAVPSRSVHRAEVSATALPGIPFCQQLHATGLLWRFGTLLGAHFAEIGLLLASWASIGYGALSGRLDGGWLAAWALCLVSMVFVRATVRSLQGTLAVGFGGLLKQRLLAGAMMMDPDMLRRKGVGEFLGETLEAEMIEGMGTSGGFEMLLASLELLVTPFLLARGAAAGSEIMLLAAWISLVLILFAANTALRSQWTKVRFSVTLRSVEDMTAHRTRIVQQTPTEWHGDEDAELQRYASLSEKLDRSTAWIEATMPRGYVMMALGVLTPSFLAGSATAAQQAITLGIVLFAGAALERLTFGMARGCAAWIAWRSVKPMFDAASRSLNEGITTAIDSAKDTVLRAKDVVFRHEDRAQPVLRDCSINIRRGDFLLLEGDSGSGKSTLAALLAGLRRPSAGLILAGALDRQTIGDTAWRRYVAVAPQYHENHIFSAPLSFNLLMGRPYPHSQRDVHEALELCHELGLGPLLGRMPAGLDQMVGETGWQLSQGERSRVFLARVLLQHPEVVVLDETLAALDPETLEQCLQCLMRHVQTLLLVAHP